MTLGPAALNECKSFTRGYLLASRWAAVRPADDVATRLPKLGDEPVGELYDAMDELPEASRSALEKVWVKREARRRLEDALGLHWTWLADVVEDEPAPLLLLALGEIEPAIAKEAFRHLWPKKKARSNEIEVTPLDPSMAGHLRRHLLARFALLGEREQKVDKLAGLLILDRRDVWMLAQDLGRATLSEMAQSHNRGALERFLQRVPGARSARIRRMVEALEPGDFSDATSSDIRPPASSPGQGKGETEEAGNADGADPAGSDDEANPIKRGLDDLDAAMAVAQTEGELFGLVGVRKLARGLADRPREFSLSLGQKMAKHLANHLITWRDTGAARGEAASDETIQEIVNGLGAAMSRSASGGMSSGLRG